MPALRGGGAERTLINLLSKMDYERYAVDLVLVTNTGDYLDQVPSEVGLIPLFKNELLVRVLAFLLRKYGIEFPFRWRICSRVRAAYDLGISFQDSIFTDLLFYLPQLGRRLSWIHSSYVTNEDKARYFRQEAYRQKVKTQRYDRLDQLIFVSHDARQEFEELFGAYPSAKVLYNVMNVDMIRTEAAAFVAERPVGFCFFTMGRLQPVKGFDRLLRALHLLLQQGVCCHLQIAGEGPERPRLEQLIADLDLHESVKLLGLKSNPYPYLRGCDAYVLSSVSEGLPTVICEALILEKPVVATDCSGARELLAKQVGLLSRQDDEDLARQMRRLVLEDGLREKLAENARLRAALFDDEKILAAYYQIFDACH